MAPLRVLIADDEVLLRTGVARVLEDAGMQIVAETGDAQEAVRIVERDRPDVAILDVQMPPGRSDAGLQAAIAIRERWPQTRVLVLSQFLEERYPLDLIGEDAEGVGYLLKMRVADIGSFVEAVRRVAAGGSALDPAVVALMVYLDSLGSGETPDGDPFIRLAHVCRSLWLPRLPAVGGRGS